MLFSADFCLGCGLCVAVCPRQAVRVKREDRLPAVGQTREVLTRAVRRCRRCGAEFPAAGEGVFCRTCAQRRSLESDIRQQLFGEGETSHR